MTKPIYKYSDTCVVKDGHDLFPQDACKDLQCLQRKVEKLEEALSCSAPAAGSVPTWIRDEIKATWNAARECGSQMEAFRIFERMTDRLGYARIENNPSLAEQNALVEFRLRRKL